MVVGVLVVVVMVMENLHHLECSKAMVVRVVMVVGV